MHVVVTGGAGFIGSHLVDALLADGCRVRVLDDLSSGRPGDVPAGAELVEGSVTDDDLLAKVVAGAEVVFHLAAHRSVFRSVEHPRSSDAVNTGGTLAVLVAARDAQVRRVVYASSSSVYGECDAPTTETAPPLPRSPYAVSKLAGEQYCRVFSELHGLETVALRYFNVYGPRQRPDSPYANLVPAVIDRLRCHRPVVVHGDGRQRRDFTYVEDAVRTTLAAARRAGVAGGRPYNVAAGRSYTVLEVVAEVGRQLGVEPALRHTEPRLGDVRRTWADTTAAETDLGHRAAIALEEGVRRTIAWLSRG